MLICIEEKDYYGFIAIFQRELLSQRIKFPLLEWVSREVFVTLPPCVQIAVCDKITSLNEMNSSVFTGTGLQMRLAEHFDESIQKSIEYVCRGDEWFHCDHLAERVLGFALLNYPEKAMPILKELIDDDDDWVVRMVGVAGHHAVRKGLKRNCVEELFRLLLSRANINAFHPQKGLGWAAKTTAKFHPDIVEKYRPVINSQPATGRWFRTRLEIGLAVSEKYSSKFTD